MLLLHGLVVATEGEVRTSSPKHARFVVSEAGAGAEENIDHQTYNKTQHKMVTISFPTWALLHGIG
jgi:hypothetical protein